MELDDLRRQWQQQPADTPAPLDAAALTQLLAQRSGNIVARLLRNARMERAANYVLSALALVGTWLMPAPWLRMYCGLLTLVGLVCIFYFYRKMGVLRQISSPAGDLKAHLKRLVDGLRALIRFYYWFTLATIPLTGLAVILLAYFKLLGSFTPAKALVVAGIELAVLYWPVARVTTWWLQRLYGQHLDRLEASLRELNEPALAAAS